jgi:tetratricopeptide (TPR) repeat protein
MLSNNFAWDDINFIINYPLIHSFNILALFGANQFNSLGFYRPLDATYFSIVYQLFTTHPVYYHLLQLLLHITNAILLYLLFKKSFGEKLSFFLSLIFLVHPVQVEAVAYISSTEYELFFLLGISALLLSIGRRVKIPLVVLLIFLSMLVKEDGLLFLFMILLYQKLFFKKIEVEYLTYGFLSLVIYSILRFSTIGISYTIRNHVPIMTLSLPQRLVNVPKVITYYVKTFVFPLNLATNQTWIVTKLNLNDFFLPVLVIVCLLFVTICFGLFLYKKGDRFKYYVFFVSWSLLGLLLHSQIIPLEFTVADRWQYFTIVGFIGILGLLIEEVIHHLKVPNLLNILAGIFILLLLITRTIVRNANWHDKFTLCSHDVKYTQSVFLENDLGAIYMSRGNLQEAEKHLKKSFNIFPYELNSLNLGTLYLKKGDITNAKLYFHNSIYYYRGFADYPVLAYQLLLYNDPEDAELIIQMGLEKKPKDLLLNIDHVVAEYNSGNRKDALNDASILYSLSPNKDTKYLFTQIQNNLPIKIK